jgi:hypothetical protein
MRKTCLSFFISEINAHREPTVLYSMERIEAWLKERKNASAEREG